jgi:LysR family glycine cleavage system transcriptional activator
VRRLPSLNALVSFEAAARLGSFTAAARELRVTQGAVSRGVAGLEAWLGVALFVRAGKTASLTPAGRAYAEEVAAALDRVSVATSRVIESTVDSPLVLDVLPTLALQWLIPRLPLYQARHPGRFVRVTTSDREIGPQDAFDVAIRRGGRRPGLRGVRFLDEWFTPVCSPAFLRDQTIRQVSDIARCTLLAVDTRSDAWPRWLDAQGVAVPKGTTTHRFNHYYVALQAAKDGLGILMGAFPLLDDEITHGELVALFPKRRVQAPSYYAFTHAGLSRPDVTAFLEWIVSLGLGGPARSGRA